MTNYYTFQIRYLKKVKNKISIKNNVLLVKESYHGIIIIFNFSFLLYIQLCCFKTLT